MNFQTAMKETVETSTLSHGMSWPIEAWDFGGTTLEASGNSQCSPAPCTRVDFWTMQHGATKLHVHVQFLCPCLSCGNKLLQKKTKHHLPICFSIFSSHSYFEPPGLHHPCFLHRFLRAFSDIPPARIVRSALQALVNPQIFAPMACQATPQRKTIAICRNMIHMCKKNDK